MGSWGSCDYKELEQLRDKLQTFQKVDYDKRLKIVVTR